MNESGYIKSLRRHLSPETYFLKLNIRFNSGVADAYLRGVSTDLWIEFKHTTSPLTKIRNPLSPLQRNWLVMMHKLNAGVAVVVGNPSHGVLLFNCPKLWTESQWDLSQLPSATSKELASMIDLHLQGTQPLSSS